MIQLKSMLLQAGKEVITGWSLVDNHLGKDNEQFLGYAHILLRAQEEPAT